MSNKLFNVKNRIVIITGGMGQLGRQYAQALVQNGAKVAIFDNNIKKNMRDIFNLKEESKNIMFLKTDITDKNSLKNSLSKLKKKWGIPHALVNNAAIDSPPNAPIEENGPFEQYPETSWDNVMEVNVKGVFLCCQIIGGMMASYGRGSIINISSVYGMVSPDQRIYEYRKKKGKSFYKPVSYSVSKSAILNITRYLSTYWAEKNVRVNTLTFSGVYNKQDDLFLKEYNKRVPLGRMAREDEYNGAVIFLISDASSYMTGSNLVIDGGYTAL